MQDEEDEDYPYSSYEIYQARHTKFLTRFPTDDLFEIDRVVRFLNLIAACVMARHSDALGMREVCEYIFCT